MIVVKLVGGLGNQMFQYAAAKSLALNQGVEVRVDLSEFDVERDPKKFTKREFALADFGLQSEVGPNPYAGTGLAGKLRTKLSQIDYYYEKTPQFEPRFFELGKNAVLDGYFQSEKYFKAHRTAILEAFRFPVVSESFQELQTLIRDQNAVSVHVRRGDYVSLEIVSQVHGALDSTYYDRAIELVTAEESSPLFVVFSDDIEWCRENLKLEGDVHFAQDFPGKQMWEDMALMSQCKHHIIANSSYSWWGAWLNPAENKKVVAPRAWFRESERNATTNDLIPGEWNRI